MPVPNLSPSDVRWPRLFDEEAPRIAEALAPIVGVEHVGSTSVPGLAAKPTIDVAVGVSTLDLRRGANQRMETLGYSYAGSLGLPQHVFRRGDGVPWQYLIHVVEYDGAMWRDFIHFRQYLRAHPEQAHEYAQLKKSLLIDRGAWYRGRDKEAFIRPILNLRSP